MALAPMWQRLIGRKGRPMVLLRQTQTDPPLFNPVTVQGVSNSYAPQDVAGDLRQGDMLVYILNTEIAVAGWPGPPVTRDQMTIDESTYSVEGVVRVWDGTALVGFKLWVRGGP